VVTALRTTEPNEYPSLPIAAPVAASGSRVMRNTGLTLAAIGVPLVSAFFVMPELTRHLGPARFGLLGLAWALLEYFSLFDVGLGRATTKFVAERIAARSPDLPQIVIVSMTSQLFLGGVAGLLLALLSPLIVGHWLVVPPNMLAEARVSFSVLSLMLPFILLSLGLRGVVEAAQRFDLSAAIRTPSSAATFLIPAVAAPFGVGLPGILVGLLAARIVTCVALIVGVRYALPGIKWDLPTRWRLPRALVSFGGWIAVSNVVSPVLVYLDRFVLGAVLGLGAVGLYTPAYELTGRLLIVPGSLLTAMFPMVSAASAADEQERSRLTRIFALSVRNLLLLLAPAVVLLCVFAPDVLRLWLGPEFANRSATALRVLAVGVMINGLSHVPCGYLQASGRPDVPARFHLLELAIHLPLTWMLVQTWGITGAALAWTIRVSLDGVLLFLASRRVLGMSLTHAFYLQGKRVLIVLSGLVVVTLALWSAHFHLAIAFAFALVILATFTLVVWRLVLGHDERSAIRRAAGLMRRRPEPSAPHAVAS
jgi:O-antigen/teichoic acid export membrane protein